mmetsp:Transcript_17569/g.24382  ORF Transcript_17569/g.24382 Transcript_17569/m.24382 type:complete len:279 (+) Transcript_17569:165-1001(+)
MDVLDFSSRSMDGHFEVVTTILLVLALLRLSSNSERVSFNMAVFVISTFSDVDAEGVLLNAMPFQCDVYFVLSSLRWLILDQIGSISLVGDLGWYFPIGAMNFDLEGLASLFHIVAVFVFGLDGKVCWKVVRDAIFKARSISTALASICSSHHCNSEWTVFDVLIVQRNCLMPENHVYCVVPFFFRCILHTECAIIVVFHFDGDFTSAWVQNIDIDRPSTCMKSCTILVSGLHSEMADIRSVATFEARPVCHTLKSIRSTFGMMNTDGVGAVSNRSTM